MCFEEFKALLENNEARRQKDRKVGYLALLIVISRYDMLQGSKSNSASQPLCPRIACGADERPKKTLPHNHTWQISRLALRDDQEDVKHVKLK